MAIATINGGSLKEIMADYLADLKVKQHFLTGKLKGGDSLNIKTANNRGFRIALDYTRNPTVAYVDPDGGSMAQTISPTLDNMTANLQYMQFGREVSNLNLANSKAGMHVGPSDVVLSAKKLLQRRAEMEEHYFCRGDGLQTIGDITTTVATTINTPGVMTLAGTRDGLGAYLISTGQYVRVHTSAGVFKNSGYITGKTSNTVLQYTPDVITTTGLADTDIVLPQGEAVSPSTTGVKGLPYLVKTSGNYFDKVLSTVTALKGTVDASTTTFTRTTMEALYRNIQTRAGDNPNLTSVTGNAQYSNYYVQFYSQNTAQVHIVGNDRPGIDTGGKNLNNYTFWGQKIDMYPFIHPKNWWMLDYSTFTRLTLKEAGAALVPGGQFIQKVSSGAYKNSQVSWDDDYLEYLSDKPFMNGGFTNLTFTGLPGLLRDSNYNG